jgi:hypothetical protein
MTLARLFSLYSALSRGRQRGRLALRVYTRDNLTFVLSRLLNTDFRMEPLSGVASGMAVVSLSLQLIQSVFIINTFIRAVKGASKELERLVESLDRLRALLEDICQLMELQTSRSTSSPGIPMPSMTIFNCLKSCEHQLLPLQSIVDKYGNVQSRDRSKGGKLWDSVTMGFKTKDIQGFEAHIQQEMANLTTALIMNSTSIQ